MKKNITKRNSKDNLTSPESRVVGHKGYHTAHVVSPTGEFSVDSNVPPYDVSSPLPPGDMLNDNNKVSVFLGERQRNLGKSARNSLLFFLMVSHMTAWGALPADITLTLPSGGGYLWEETIPVSTYQALSCAASAASFYVGVGNVSSWNMASTSDGKFGFSLAPDVVLTLRGGVEVLGGPKGALQLLYTDSNLVTWSGAAASDAVLATATAGQALMNFSVGSKQYTSYPSFNSSSSSLLVGVYAGPLAEVGSYSHPELRIGFGCIPVYTNKPLLAISGSITLEKPILTACTLSIPTLIDFGRVNINGVATNSLLASKIQNLNMTCSGDPGVIAEKMDISFQGDYEGGYFGRLSVKNSAGDQMAFIRARYLNDSGSCAADAQNEINFSGTNKTINNVGVGLTTIPITWSLCSNASKLLGEGTAQATVNVNWN